MEAVTSTRALSRPTTPADLHRLAALAHARGVRLTQAEPGVWFASSVSTDAPHYVTGFSCSCPGFCYHQRCTHHALLLDRLGWLPEMESDAAEVAAVIATPELVPCYACSGGGIIYVPDCARAGWPHPACPECNGSGALPAMPHTDTAESERLTA